MLDVSDLIGWNERDHDPALAGSGGPARSVEVGLLIGGKVEVDDGLDILDMYASRDDVGRDQRLYPSGGEVLQGSGSLVLVPLAMDRSGPDALPIKLAGYPVAAMTGSTKDDRRSCGIDHVGADLDPVGPRDGPEQVVSSDDIGSCVAYFVAYRITLVVADE